MLFIDRYWGPRFLVWRRVHCWSISLVRFEFVLGVKLKTKHQLKEDQWLLLHFYGYIKNKTQKIQEKKKQ